MYLLPEMLRKKSYGYSEVDLFLFWRESFLHLLPITHHNSKPRGEFLILFSESQKMFIRIDGVYMICSKQSSQLLIATSPKSSPRQHTGELKHTTAPCPTCTFIVVSIWKVHPVHVERVLTIFCYHEHSIHGTIILITTFSCEELTHWKRPWCWEGLGSGGERDDRGWDGWMASLTWWTWVWVDSGSWWWTGRPGVLRFMGLQRVGHDRVTELNWVLILLMLLFSCSIMSDSSQPHGLPGSSVHGISQARILEWVAISFSSGSPRPRDSEPASPAFAGRFFTTKPSGKPT